MVTALFRYERIRTTKAKAREISRTAERLITRARVDSVHNRRQAGAQHPRQRDSGQVVQRDCGPLPRSAGRLHEAIEAGPTVWRRHRDGAPGAGRAGSGFRRNGVTVGARSLAGPLRAAPASGNAGSWRRSVTGNAPEPSCGGQAPSRQHRATGSTGEYRHRRCWAWVCLTAPSMLVSRQTGGARGAVGAAGCRCTEHRAACAAGGGPPCSLPPWWRSIWRRRGGGCWLRRLAFL